MAGMDWFRWHHGSVTDPKFQLIARKTKSRVADVIAVWAFLLEAASQADERGNPGAQDFEAIDCALGLDDGQAAAIHASMIDRGIVDVGGSIAKWDTRQPKREREGDNSTERSRASRARKSQQEPIATTNDDATPCNAMQRQETPRVEKRREEKIEIPSVTDVTGGKPPLTPEEIIFGYGLPILTNAGTPEKQARSFLGGLRKAHGDDSLVNTLRECIRAKPLQPLEWLAKAMPPDATGVPAETRYQKSKREQMERDFPNLTSKPESCNVPALELD